ncbi:uncharacterized protein EV154DRAFT_561859 [Mucor mucedo]|uniref:uncharacterized protein n=1 Tax=Mucor mucedo TaxID=29922 RepID=UPI00221E8E8F|nr:uncharacterized protein EV154DRAFT_561859 [Mucor mucedo]KAI7892944.1 hypothetical protein EV154DRAFT_561859 [Mucor mucedo]
MIAKAAISRRMNNIIDISDDTAESHLGQLSIDAQLLAKQLFPTPAIEYKAEEDNDEFLDKVINEVDRVSSDKIIRRIYSQILETLRYDSYLYNEEEKNSEADYIIKLYGPIMENLFRGSGCRLVWIFARNITKSPDLCIAEYAKEATPAKYFYDKTKIVIATLVHLKEHISRGKLTLDQAKLFVVPFVLCEGLEAEIHCLRLVSDDWCIVEKQLCLALKNQTTTTRRKSRGMSSIRQGSNFKSFQKRRIWSDLNENDWLEIQRMRTAICF